MKNVTAPFSDDLERKTRIAAACEGISRSEFIRLAVIERLQRLQQAGGKVGEMGVRRATVS